MERMVTLLTTEQIIITSLKSAETEDNHILIIMRGPWTRHEKIRAAHLAFFYSSGSSCPQKGIQQMGKKE
jgi:hypothetical protein